jgi:hypothetical protein
MIPSRVRRAIVGCAVVMLAATMGVGIARTAVASVPHPTVRDTDGPVPAHGVPTGYVRDTAGTTHLVVIRNDGVQYLTRRHGRTTWVSRHVPGSAQSGLTSARLVLSTDGSHEFLLVQAGRRLSLVAKKTSAPNFPRITAESKIAAAHTTEPFSVLPALTALPHGRVEVMYRGEGSVLRATIARPGRVIDSEAVANDFGGITSGGIVRDAQTGEVFAAVRGEDTRHHKIVAWMWPSGGHPADFGLPFANGLRHPQPGTDVIQSVTGVTMLQGRAWTALTGSSTPEGPTRLSGVFIARCRIGTRLNGFDNRVACSSEQRLPHTDRRASHLLLVADPQRHQLQAVFEESGDGSNGIMHEVRRSDGTWSSPTRVTRGSDDQPLFLVGTTDHGFRYLFERNG